MIVDDWTLDCHACRLLHSFVSVNLTKVELDFHRRRGKSNESYSWKKHFAADDRLLLQQNWSSGDFST